MKADELKPAYRDTLERLTVLLQNNAPLGLEIHSIVQAHAGNRSTESGRPYSTGGRITQADLRAITRMDCATDRLCYRIALLLDRGVKPEAGELKLERGWRDGKPVPEAPEEPRDYCYNQYVKIDSR